MHQSTDHLPLFVYGTLMSDQPAYGRLAAAVVRTEAARLAGATLHVVSWYPLAAPGQGVVCGEVMWLAKEEYARVLAELDAYEGDEYERVVRMVRLLDREDEDDKVACWLYLGAAAEAAAHPEAPGGDWRTYLRTVL